MILATPAALMGVRLLRDAIYLHAAEKALKSHGVDGVTALAHYLRAIKAR